MPRLVTPGVNNLFAMARCRAVASLDADKVRTSHQGLDLVPTWVLTSRNGLAYVLAYGGIPLAARGSATASLVVWALGLSELCPLDYDLDGRMLASDNDSCILGPFLRVGHRSALGEDAHLRHGEDVFRTVACSSESGLSGASVPVKQRASRSMMRRVRTLRDGSYSMAPLLRWSSARRSTVCSPSSVACESGAMLDDWPVVS
jgi:hypothetical protein